MKVELLRDDSNKQASLISESVVTTQANIHPVREQPDNMTYIQSRGPYVWQQFAMTIKEMIQTHLTLVHAFQAMSRWAFMRGPYTILVYIL
jgi:hypothetical protein